MLRFDLSPKFSAYREPRGEPSAASEVVRAKRARARRLERARAVAAAFVFLAAAPFLAFKAKMIGAPGQGDPPTLAAKAPLTPPAPVALAPAAGGPRLAREGVDFTATSATCAPGAKGPDGAQCDSAKRGGKRQAATAKPARKDKSAKAVQGAKGGARDAADGKKSASARGLVR